MNRTEANKEAKKIYEKWRKEKDAIEKKAKEDGTWQSTGVDANNHLFKELDNEVKEKLKKLEEMIDEE